MNIGKVIKNRRLELDYTQDELVNYAEVSKPTIVKIENSVDLIGLNENKLNKVLVALGLTKEDLKQEEVIDLDNFVLNETNYHSTVARKLYCGASQFKAFMKCESEALAEINGDIAPLETKSLLEGSYMDAIFEGKDAFRRFRESHPEIYTARGELKSEFKKADLAYDRVSQDETFMEFMDGDKQVILTGEIAGVKYKVKLDVLNMEKPRIVDLKYVKDFNLIWDDEDKVKKHFIEYWGYVIQGAIYREIVRQVFGIKMPFYIAAITKEDNTNYDIFEIAEKDLEEALEYVKEKSPHIQALKDGKEQPRQCGNCRYCRSVKKLKGATVYTKYVEELI